MNLIKSTAAAALAVVLFTATASAATITFNTNQPGTGFGGTSLVLNNALGASATLAFIPAINISSGVPSNVNFGNFTLVCATCSTQSLGIGSFFNPFTFDMVLNDITDGSVGKFVGTSTGGTVYSDVSQITVNWAPLVLGPGTLNAISGNFGGTRFSTTVFTGIVAPNSGAVPGQSTVQGYVDSTAVPEPATFAVVGLTLFGIGLLRRTPRSRK